MGTVAGVLIRRDRGSYEMRREECSWWWNINEVWLLPTLQQ